MSVWCSQCLSAAPNWLKIYLTDLNYICSCTNHAKLFCIIRTLKRETCTFLKKGKLSSYITCPLINKPPTAVVLRGK